MHFLRKAPYGRTSAPTQCNIKLTEELNALCYVRAPRNRGCSDPPAKEVVVEIHVDDFIVIEPSAQTTDLMMHSKVFLLEVGEEVNPGGMLEFLGRT